MENPKNSKDMSMLDLQLYKIFRKMNVPREELSLRAELTSDLGFDNFDMNIFLFLLESKFNIQIHDNEVNQLKTVGHTVHFIEEKLDVFA